MIAFVNMVDVIMPYHFNLFFTGVTIMSSMDLFRMEAKYEEYLTFAQTNPMNSKFEFFGTGDRIFVANSGSLLAMMALIYIDSGLRKLLNYICTKFP